MSKIGQILIKFSKVLFFGWNDACSQKKSPKAMFAIISVKILVQKRQNGGFSMIYVHISAISHKKSIHRHDTVTIENCSYQTKCIQSKSAQFQAQNSCTCIVP